MFSTSPLQFYAFTVYTIQSLISAILVVAMYNKTQNNFLPNIFKTDQQLLNHASVMAKCIFTFSLIHQEMDDSQFILYSDVLRL